MRPVIGDDVRDSAIMLDVDTGHRTARVSVSGQISAFPQQHDHMSAIRVKLKLEPVRQVPVDASPARFGSLVGVSTSMRAVFALLQRAAASPATLLIEGETGTGKTQVAESIHCASRRRRGPFVTLDCSALPANLIESEIFGHERWAFPGASEQRLGIFEKAAEGTVFIDEIGELPRELQPKLLRVLENREIRRLGSKTARPVDVRVIAATNRDLRTEVAIGRFRSDLYFRLAVVKVLIPPLRERREDIAPILKHLLASLGARSEQCAALLDPESLARLSAAAWPGNVRELRNYVERCLLFDAALPVSERYPRMEPSPGPSPNGAAPFAYLGLPLSVAKERALDDFEKRYLEEVLRQHGGNVSQAARAAEITCMHLHLLLVRHGLKK